MITVRNYGESGPLVIILHGGPGAPGYMAPVARGLCDPFRVIEPLQRRSGQMPLSVACHVEDLHVVLNHCGPGSRPALVGSSWGAMLALAYAAAHPDRSGPLVLIGCGTFDIASRKRMEGVIEQRTDDDFRQKIQRAAAEQTDPDEQLKRQGELLLPLYSHDLMTDDLEIQQCDWQGNHETWEDMLRQQEAGVYPAAFSSIKVPVLMLHGAIDPHPGRMIEDCLKPYLPQLEYHEWAKCGHYPWLERAVHREFFARLRQWLLNNLAQ